MFTFCILLAATCGVLVGMAIASAGAERRRADVVRDAEERAFKRGELAAWQESTQRLQASL